MLRRLLLILVLAIHMPLANAALVGSGNIDVGYGESLAPVLWGSTPVQTNVIVGLFGSMDGTTLAQQIFTVGSSDFTTTFSSGTTFDVLVALLTNGQNDTFSWSVQNFAGGVSTGTAEKYFFAGNPHLVNGIDFAGSHIDHVDLFITNKSASPGANPNGDGVWTDWTFNVAMNVYGTPPVPEPETYAMLLAGLGFVGAIARRRKGVPAT